MYAHVSVNDTNSTNVAPRVKRSPNYNKREVADMADALNTSLLEALPRGNAAIDAALTALVEACTQAGQAYFITMFGDRTKVSGKLIARVRELNLRFGLYWTEGGPGDEAMTSLPPSEQTRLTNVLRTAVQTATFGALDRALEDIAQTCKSFNVRRFTTPYRNHTDTARELIWRLNKNDVKVFLDWTPDGLDGEPEPVLPVAKAKRSRAEQEAITAANRARRHAAQPAKGYGSKK